MEITPGRAPFTEDEDYTPLRKPKSATNTPTHGSNAYNPNNLAGAGGGGPGGNEFGMLNAQANFGRVSPSKLSPFAKEFVPRFGNNASGTNVQERLEKQQRHQLQYNQQQYQQYHQQQRQQQHAHHQQQQQRQLNGYQQKNAHHNHPHNQQPNQQKIYNAPPMTSLTASVQERLKISGGAGGSGSSSGGAGKAGSNKNPSNMYHQHNQHNRQKYQHQHHQRPHPSTSRNHNMSGGGSRGGNGADSGAAEVENIALDYLRTVVQCLNQNPGQFDTVATRFLTIFDGMENNQYVLSNAMEDIFNESIQNPNFRYMGAKLYNLLHMLNLKKDSLFHTLLKCKLDYHQKEVIQYMGSNQQQKVRETALFLAELYMQLRGDDSRIHLIAENIVYSLKQLLLKESADNIRCICLTLKLAGYDLTSDCVGDMQEIIAQLDAINVKNPGKYPLAANVISLQKNNWGRKLHSSTSISEELAKPSAPLRTSDEPIFYGPDGHELTAEETDFLTGGAAATSGACTDDEDMGDLDVDLDPEMDEETEKAYKEFCKLNATA